MAHFNNSQKKRTAWPIRLLGYCLSVCFFSLALMHFSPDSRFAVQSWLIGLDVEFQQSLYEISGGPYFIHNYEDSMALHVSMVHKLPTRYVRDIIFWSRLTPGVSFAVEPMQQNDYGVEFLFFENKPGRYELAMSIPYKERICLKGFAVWRFEYRNIAPLPSYTSVDYQYTLSFSTDDTGRWQQIEAPCT